MSRPKGLADLLKTVNAHKGSWGKSLMVWDEEANAYQISRNDSTLAIDVDFALWDRYDPDTKFLYARNGSGWDDILEKTITNKSYSKLTKDQTLNILFGLHHRNRIVDGLWLAMFREGVTQQLLERLLELELNNSNKAL